MRFKKFLKFLVKYKIIKILINLIVLIGIFIIFSKTITGLNSLFNFFDFTIISSIIVVSIVNIIILAIEKMILNKIEDSLKVTTNYNKLISNYVFKNEYEWKNTDPNTIDQNLPELITYKSDKLTVFPEILSCDLYRKQIEIVDCTNLYTPPQFVNDNYFEIIKSHQTSDIYNQLNIRVDDWYFDDSKQKFIIKSSRTNYFHSLVTNRAMDYKLSNGFTVRSLYDYGPFVNPLSKSVLSNHLGFNGIIETSDNMILFIKRNKHLSTGKNVYGTSIAASLKSKYAIKNNAFTLTGLKSAIINEIYDECKIHYPAKDFSLEENLIAAYRDLVEGGKPQLVFYIHLQNITMDELRNNFNDFTKKNKNKKHSTLEDGHKFLWIPKKDIHEITFGQDYFQYKNKKYYTTPSMLVSFVLYIKHINRTN